MLYFKLNADKTVAEISSVHPQTPAEWASTSVDGSGWLTRHDLQSVADAELLAAAAQKRAGKTYLAVDSGKGVWPRFDVIEAPEVGEPVSYGFNGDYYPCGHIKSISANFRLIVTTAGQKFYRRRQSANWVHGKIWSLVDGHRSELNPSF